MGEKKILGILPNYYVHVLDLITNVTTVECGPQNLILQDNHKQVAGPLPFIKVPPGHYCIVNDPIDKSKPVVEGKLYELRFGHKEVRLHGSPFPLYPGETLAGASPADYTRAVKSLPVIKPDHGIHLRALVAIEKDETGVPRGEGEEWQLKGPITYIPQPEVEVVRYMSPHILTAGHALRLRAKQDLVDMDGNHRCTGQEWLVRNIGAYLPGVLEEVVEMVDATTLNQTVALHIKANENYTDQFGTNRNIGDEWLVTLEDTDTYIPDITEELVKVVHLTVLTKRHYAVVMDPIGTDGRPQLGCKELRKGPMTFFLHPGERLESGIKNSLILGADEAVMVTAHEEFVDILQNGNKIHRTPGDRWMVFGPTEYIPPIQVGKVTRRKAIPLNKNEGIYVRNIQTGQVRSIMGPQAYLLQANEELYEKEVVPLVEELLKHGGGIGDDSIRKMSYFEGSVDPALVKNKKRDKTRVVTYRCPSNSAVQVYNYRQKTARVVFGPDLVVLEPHETFNVLFLSAGKPKKEGALITVCLMLGPDFISDHITVETSDHARLNIALSMNNYFRVDPANPESASKLFSVPDFIGFACREVASRIRGVVAGVPFEQFHKYSSEIIHAGVFGKDSEGKIRQELVFSANNLVITNIDVQSIEPVDRHMRDSLSKSVQMAIEISTKSIERYAQHEAQRTEQKARGELERQKLENEMQAEEARRELLELQAVAAAVESSGQAKAEAQAQAERLLIEGQSAIELAQLKADAARIEMEAELECQENAREAEILFLKEQNELEIARAKQLGVIEVNKFSETVKSIGQETLARIANAGPETKVKLLQSLGLQSVLITDGKSPVNLFQGTQGCYMPPPASQ